MKQKLKSQLKTILVGLMLLMFANTDAQRICGSMDYLNNQIKSDPSIIQRRQNIETHTQAYQSSLNKAAGVIVTIPVVVHVVYNTTAQNISQAQIQSQIDILNADYRKLNADTGNVPALFKSLAADCKVEFVLAKRDPAGNSTTGIIRKQTTTTSFTSNDNVKYSSKGGDDAWASSSYLNLWVCPLGGGLLGYAQFPGSGAAATDGVVINVTAFGNTGTAAAPYNKGRTATHEVGHWLNLYHIWGDDSGACTGSDNVGDTPNQGAENYGCPTYPHASCSNTSDMFMNYMDYVDDACMNMFSVGQGARMSALFASGGARASLLSSLGGVAPGTGTSCSLPSGLSTSSITTNTAVLNWTAVSGATSYNIQYKSSASATFTTLTSTTNSISLAGLIANTSYTYQVQTVCSNGLSAYSAAATFNTSVAATCVVPTGLASSSITSSAATLSWTAVSGATGYLLQYKTSSATAFTSVSSATNSISITGLSATTTYTYQVQSVCSSTLSSAFSSPSTFTTSASTACVVPTGISSSSITSSSAVISWAAVSGATGYKVQYKTSATATYTSITSATNTVTLTGLSASTAYTYQVQTVCSSSLSSSWSTAANFSTLATTTCSTPTGISVANITATGATLSWTAVTGAASYSIQYKTAAATSFTTLTSTTNNIAISGLTASTAYTYQVKTICSNGLSSSLSTSATFTTLAAATCTTPSGASVSNITASGANITWTAVTGAQGYKLQYKASTASTYTLVSVTNNSYAMTGLSAGTTYSYQVQTVCSSSLLSPMTSAATFTTIAPATCTDNYETNETQATAKAITTGAAITAKIGTSTDKDWFSFNNTSTAKNIQVVLNNLPADYDLYLYNASGTLLASSLSASTTSETVKYNNGTVGTYYIKVIGYNGVFSAVNCYSLIANISSVAYRISAPEFTKTESIYTIFPNPAQNELNVDFVLSNKKSVEVRLYDITGKLVLSNVFEGNEGLNKNVIDLSALNKGIYILECNDGEKVQTSKLIIEK